MKKNITVLHVEDNPGDILLLEEILSDSPDFDFSITIANSLGEAVIKSEPCVYDIILLDLGLPDSMGMQALELMLEKCKMIPIMVITGLNDDQAGRQAVKLGAQSYLPKNELNTRVVTQSIVYSIERNQQLIRIRNAESELIRKNKLLEEANSSKDRLLSIISHDLKSPMSSVVGLLSLLNEEYSEFDQTKRQEYIKICYENANATLQLIETLLGWAQSQSKHRVIKPISFELKNLANQSFAPLLELSKLKNITIANAIAEDIKIYADIEMISTVLRNLVSNAIKFSNKGGLINLGANVVEDSKIVLSIQDKGIGIDEKSLKKILDIREGYTTPGTENEKGTGFGLILCREFVEKNGGNLWIESVSHQGTTVYFSLPLASSETCKTSRG